MKGKNLLLSLFLIPAISMAQVISVKTEIKNVKVYLTGAELFHTAKVKLDKGNSEILFENIATDFDINSVSVTGKGNFLITSIGQQYDYLKNSVKPAEIKILEDSLDAVDTELKIKRNGKEVLWFEQELIMNNRNLSGKNNNVALLEVQKYADYLRKRITEIKNETLILDKAIAKLQKNYDRINKQLQALNSKYNHTVNQISVNVTANAPVNAEFEISYLVNNASWVPVYDIRVQDISKPIKLGYTAKVRQNTGIDWDDVKIILSSRNPYFSQNKPELNTWFIDFDRLRREGGAFVSTGEVVVARKLIAQQSDMAKASEQSMANYTIINENMLAFEFESSIPYSIPSDGKPHSVILKDYELNGTFDYYAVPKLEKDAFLVAYLTKWNEYNLLPGEVNTYFQNSFVGKTYLNPNISKDTLTLSLGRDNGINVERKPVKDYTEDKFLSSDIERTFAYDIVLKNNKNKAVKVTVEDQVPVSRNEDITVKLIELSGAVYNKETGKVKWILEIEPGKSVTKKFVYSVRHPKDKPVTGL